MLFVMSTLHSLRSKKATINDTKFGRFPYASLGAPQWRGFGRYGILLTNSLVIGVCPKSFNIIAIFISKGHVCSCYRCGDCQS